MFSLSKANDPFESLFLNSPQCLHPLPLAGCSTSMPDAFTSKYPITLNRPTTGFYLFTAASPDRSEPLHECGGRLPDSSTFDPRHPTEVIVHGWLDGVCRTAWMREIKEQLQIKGSYNIILVDWNWGNTFDYAEAGGQSQVVGDQLAFVINNILSQKNMTASNFHIVGHSFGAQAASIAGKGVRKLGRITGLDATHTFSVLPPSQRLSRRDASFVDVIHSNSHQCVVIAIGRDKTVGHQDFFPNGGFIQKSCIPYIFTSFLKLDLLTAIFSLVPHICSHIQAIQFYKVSINAGNDTAIGVRCGSYRDFRSGKCKDTCEPGGSNCAVMGMDAEPVTQTPGRFYLDTAPTCPYRSSTHSK